MESLFSNTIWCRTIIYKTDENRQSAGRSSEWERYEVDFFTRFTAVTYEAVREDPDASRDINKSF